MSSTKRPGPHGNLRPNRTVNQMADNLALPEPEPWHMNSDTTEDWLNASIRSRITAAFHTGRLLNQLNWHMQKCLFLISLNDKKMVAETLNRLVAISYWYASQSSNQLEAAIIEVRENVDDRLDCEAVADEVASCIRGVEQYEETRSPEERRQELVDLNVRPIIDTLRNSFWEKLSEDEKRVMRLGQCLDQGIRCPDPYRFIEPERQVRSGWYNNEQHSDAPRWIGIRYLCHSFQPGELEPDLAWFTTLNELLAITGMPVALTAPILAAWRKLKPQEQMKTMPQMLEQLDHAIRNFIDSGSPSEMAPSLPVITTGPKSAWIDWGGTKYQVCHATADAFQMMINAKGQPVGLGKYVLKSSRWIQKLRATAPELAKLVVRADGNRGYRMTIFDLPPNSA